MTSQEFSQPLSSMPEFFTQDAFKPAADEGPDGELRTPPEREMSGWERQVTAKMVKFVEFNKVVRMTVCIKHTMTEGIYGVPPHVRLLTGDHDDGKPIYAILETEQYRYEGPHGGAKDGVAYDLRAIVIGHRCVVPIHWTPLGGDKPQKPKDVENLLKSAAKSCAYVNDKRFVHMFAGEKLSDEVQPRTAWDDKVEILDSYSNGEL